MCTYARIDSVEMPRPREMMDWWEDPSSYFLLQGERPCYRVVRVWVW